MKLLFGVPCSRLKDKIKDVDVHCTSEEQAMAVAFGCILCGKKPTVYMQNSGIGRIGDICLSLYMPYNVKNPKLLLSVRRYPLHHKFMYDRTMDLLNLFGFDKENIEYICEVEENGNIVQSKSKGDRNEISSSRGEREKVKR
jgi:hypothetical protein